MTAHAARQIRSSLVARRCRYELREEPPGRQILAGPVEIHESGVGHGCEAVKKSGEGSVLPGVGTATIEIGQNRRHEGSEVVSTPHRRGIGRRGSPGMEGHPLTVARSLVNRRGSTDRSTISQESALTTQCVAQPRGETLESPSAFVRAPSDHGLRDVYPPVNRPPALVRRLHALSEPLKEIFGRHTAPAVRMVMGVVAEVPDTVHEPSRDVGHCRMLSDAIPM